MSSTDPLVTTDQSDYAPGSTATITAAGFGIGDPLNFQITVIDPATQAGCGPARAGSPPRAATSMATVG